VADPYPVLHRFRTECPAYFWEPVKGYIFFRYHDVMALFREPHLGTDPTLGAGFPPETRAAFPDYVTMRECDLFTLDPDAHARIRKLVNPLFTPRAIETHRQRIARIVDEVLDTLPAEGTINFFRDVAQKYPVRVIAAMLHIPSGHEADFIALADALIATIVPGLSPEAFAAYMPAISRGLSIIRECIAARRDAPLADDLLSLLIHACDDEARLSDSELLSLVGGLLIGGTDTTVHLTTYTVLELLRHPEQLALVRAEPSLARLALDETLRYNPFGRGPGVARFARASFFYQGVRIERGQTVFLNMMSAFRDPEFIADADVFDIRRRINASPWFGLGPHFCVGASLARLEAELALQGFLARYPRIELTSEPVYGQHPVFRDIIDLPLRVTRLEPGFDQDI
jgi:cytochrome P450